MVQPRNARGEKRNTPHPADSAKESISFQPPELARRPSSTRPRVWGALGKKLPRSTSHFSGGLAAAQKRTTGGSGGVTGAARALAVLRAQQRLGPVRKEPPPGPSQLNLGVFASQQKGTVLKSRDTYRLPTTGLEMAQLFGIVIRSVMKLAPHVPLGPFYKYQDFLKELPKWMDPRACSYWDSKTRMRFIRDNLPPWPLDTEANTLLCMLIARFPASAEAFCPKCLGPPHVECNIQAIASIPRETGQAKRGRAQQRKRDHERNQNKAKVTCNNWNSAKGCDYKNCRFAHVCSKCRSAHKKEDCPLP